MYVQLSTTEPRYTHITVANNLGLLNTDIDVNGIPHNLAFYAPHVNFLSSVQHWSDDGCND